jgi:hypothetical protein
MFLKKEIIQTIQQNNLIIQNVAKVSEEELKVLYQLYRNVSLNAKEIKVKAFPYSFFQKINTHFNQTNYVIVYSNQKIIGFGLLLKHKNVSRCFCLGLDYEYAKQNNLWYVIVLNAIQHSIKHNYEKIEFGNSNFAMKKKIGAIEERIIFSIRLKNNKLNKILSPFLRKLVNQTFKTENNN